MATQRKGKPAHDVARVCESAPCPDAEPPLEYGVDLNAMRFKDGARENAASDGPVTAGATAEAFRHGYTLQVIDQGGRPLKIGS